MILFIFVKYNYLFMDNKDIKNTESQNIDIKDKKENITTEFKKNEFIKNLNNSNVKKTFIAKISDV